MQILAHLLPAGDPQKVLLTQLGKNVLPDTTLTQIPAEIDTNINLCLAPRQTLNARIDEATAAITVVKVKYKLLTTAANKLKEQEGMPIISIRDYVDAQRSFILGFNPAIEHSAELRLNGIPWQLCSNPIVDRDGIFAWGAGFAGRVDYIRSKPNGRIIFIAHCPIEGSPQFEAEPAYRAFPIWQQVLQTVGQDQLNADTAAPWRGRANNDQPQAIPQENQLSLFRYHCFLQAFRLFYPKGQNGQADVRDRGRLEAAAPPLVVANAVVKCIGCSFRKLCILQDV